MIEAKIVLITVPDRACGESIASVVVGEALAACVNIVGPVVSVYWWEEKVCRDEEHLLVIKTSRQKLDALERRVRALHPYAVPEFVVLGIESGSQPYLDWLVSSVRR